MTQQVLVEKSPKNRKIHGKSALNVNKLSINFSSFVIFWSKNSVNRRNICAAKLECKQTIFCHL